MADDKQDPTHRDPVEKTPEKPQDSWMDRLADRSTGLPDVNAAPKPSKPQSPWAYAGMGVQFAGTVVVFVLIGYYLDREHPSWSPWGILSCTLTGLVGSFYLMIKEAIKINK